MSGWWPILLSIVLGVVANELGDFCPWLARHLVRWAATRWADRPDEAAGYAEEWAAIIEERPGKLFKLLTAVGFAIGATATWQRRVLGRRRFSLSRLALLVGAVVTAAVGALGTVAWLVAQRQGPSPSLMTVAMLVSLVAVASLATARIRVGSLVGVTSWTGAALLVGFSVAPMSWVVVSAALGVAIANTVARRPLVKAAFNTGKATLTAAAAGVTWTVLLPGGPPVEPWGAVGALALVQLTTAVADGLMVVPVIAAATSTGVVQHLRTATTTWMASLLLQFPVAVLVVVVLQVESQLLVAVPPLVLSLHLWHSSRLRTRVERQAWQRLAAATDTFKTNELDDVLHTAARSAAQLFSAQHAEIEIDAGGQRRLVRSDDHHILFDGAPQQASAPNCTGTISVPVEGHGSTHATNVLRLRYDEPVTLSERETATLRTFASALHTAVRNASAYAELARRAQQHVLATHDPLNSEPVADR